MPDPTGPNDPLDPALDDRLSRLAPGVDPDAATTAFSRHRAARAHRRRAVTAGAIAAAVVVLAGLAAALALPGDDGQQVLAGSTTEVPEPRVTAPTGLDEGERRTTTSDQGLTLAMDTPETADVGGRMWVDVTLTNRRTDTVTIGAVAPCHEPLGALAGSIDAVRSVEADLGEGAFAVDPPGGSGVEGSGWSGALPELPAVLADGSPPEIYAGRSASQLATTWAICDAMARPPEPLGPGASVSRRIAIDLRWVTAEPADGEALDVLASTGRVEAADGTDLGPVTVQQPVVLRDPVDRRPSFDAAVAPGGIAAAPTLPEWLEVTGDLGPDPSRNVVQVYQVEMTWWNGAWEAWILPAVGNGHQADPLRIRFDPDRMVVVDVRTVFGNAAPADDPDRPEPTEPVDEVRFHED